MFPRASHLQVQDPNRFSVKSCSRCSSIRRALRSLLSATSRLMAISLSTLLFASASTAADTALKLTFSTKLIPKQVIGNRPAQLFVTTKTESSAPLRLTITPPTGFTADPSSLDVGNTGAPMETTKVITIRRRLNTPYSTGSMAILVSLSQASAGKPADVASQLLEFDATPLLSLKEYFALGLIGLLLGYTIRVFVLALTQNTPTARAQALAQFQQANATPPPWIRRIVVKYYYAVDFAVTVLIGFLVLVSLMQNGQPPQTSPFWHNAFGLGVGLGFLTNSELLTKIH